MSTREGRGTCLCIDVSVYVCVCVSACLRVYVSMCLCVYLLVRLCVYVSMCLCVKLPGDTTTGSVYTCAVVILPARVHIYNLTAIPLILHHYTM